MPLTDLLYQTNGPLTRELLLTPGSFGLGQVPDLYAPDAMTSLSAKTRYRMPDATCRVELRDDRRCHAMFDDPQWAPTPGQYLVLYAGDACLGGGVIA